MDIFDKLIKASSSTEELSHFLIENNNSIELSDFFVSQPYDKLVESRNEIENFILPFYGVYSQLNLTNPNEVAFISYLLEYSERFGLIGEFERLFNLHKNKHLQISSRLLAASKFLIGIVNVSDYSTRIPGVLSLLRTAYLEEEDTSDIVYATIVNYYAQVVHNFADHNVNAVIEFRKNLKNFVLTDDFSFLKCEIYESSLKVELNDNIKAYQVIQNILDEFLSRTIVYLPFNRHTLLIETQTTYYGLLQDIDSNFRSLRSLSSRLYREISDDSIFYSLQRGVAVLTEQNQMLAYIHSYGNMHYAKMQTALSESTIIENIDDGDIEIYDWGCGQGLASFILQEMHPIPNSKVTLIEPSEVCLKRASLHLKKIRDDIEITTINKDLDSLKKKDFNSDNNAVKIHLFSNILDVQSFSMEELLSLISGSFKGKNIFVCVSPFINLRRTNRLNNFMNAFSSYDDFKIYLNVNNSSGTWQRNWSRSVRVFKVNINANA